MKIVNNEYLNSLDSIVLVDIAKAVLLHNKYKYNDAPVKAFFYVWLLTQKQLIKYINIALESDKYTTIQAALKPFSNSLFLLMEMASVGYTHL